MNARTKLMSFGAYSKALELFDFVVADMALLASHRACERLVSQQLASADSIASNIEEGYGRGTKKEYCQFLVISRGSAQETAGRYRRLRHWLPDDLVAQRIALCDEIIGILTASIKSLRLQLASPK
jgi:four helix bundle protein